MRASIAIIAALALFAGLVNGQAACTPGSGNVVILTSLDDYDKVKTCTSMVGLTIQNQAFTGDLSFPQLTTLTRPISITNSSITSLSMPALTAINGAISITACTALETVVIGAETGAGVVQNGGDVNLVLTNLVAAKNIRIGLQKAARATITAGVTGNTGTLSFPFLASINTQFSLSSSSFGTVSLPLFASTLGFVINNNAIGVLNIPKNLTTVTFEVTKNTGLTSVTVNPISVGTVSSVSNFLFNENTGTGFSLDLPSLKAVFGNFQVLSNVGLVGLSVAKPFGARNVSISGNSLNNVYLESVTCSGTASFTNNKPTANAPGIARLGFFVVGSNLEAFGNIFDTISFPILRAVGGTVAATDNNLSSLIFDSTFVANGTLSFISNTFTGTTGTNLVLSGLQATNGSLLITGNSNADQQTALNFRDLQVVAQQLLVDNNNFVSSISVPNLSIVGALSGGSQYTGAESSSFIVRNNAQLLTFTGTGTQFIIVGNLTISNNDAITSINANSMGQAGALSIQNNVVLTSFTGTGLLCAAIVEFNAVPQLTTVTLTSLSSIEQTVVIAQGDGITAGTCNANINSTSGSCVGGTPACYNCDGTGGSAGNCGTPIAGLSVLCGTSKSFCPTARALSLINVGNGGTNTVDGAGTFGSGAGSGSQLSTSSSSTDGSNGVSSTPSSTRASSAITNVAALFVVVIALFAGF
eukprot:TRINITY_DN14942_c0_g1_i1.p1 TRINITY_DN14942_c0_g1~~TRINITY_DN14942_c0_g1_i1.p1  ORF type:complete len:700 (+),score=274.33 TRINITY_DN14942_c0_g1_i1:79-2178(+)